MPSEILKTLLRVYIKGGKNWYIWEVIAYGGYFYFAADAAVNFLERELGMKRGVSWGQHFLIHFHPWLPNYDQSERLRSQC